MNHIEIYTDGACKGNPGLGGWGAVLLSGGSERELFGGEVQTTNNRLDALVSVGGHQIDWRWVKGHSGDAGNDRADMLANRGVDQARARGRGVVATAGR